MRILFVSREYPPETGGGGIGSYLATLAPALAARGHIVHILSCFPGQLSSDTITQGVHLHRRPWQIPLPYFSWEASKILSRRFQTFVRIITGLSAWYWYRKLGEGFDVIEYPDWLAEGWLFSLYHPSALIAHLHTPLPLIAQANQWQTNLGTKIAGRLERISVENADLVLAPSEMMVQKLVDINWQLENTRVQALPSSPPPRLIESRSVDSTLPVVIYIARLEYRKAPEVLVEAMQLIKKELPAARCIFIGSDHGTSSGQPYIDWLQGNYSTDNCEFIGYLPQAEIGPHIQAARVFALPSRLDNFPVSAMEAMSHGRPVVLSDAVGLADLVENGEAGSIVGMNDPQALANALLPYLLDPAYAARVGRCARQLAETLQSNEDSLAQREAYYQEAINRFRSNKNMGTHEQE